MEGSAAGEQAAGARPAIWHADGRSPTAKNVPQQRWEAATQWRRSAAWRRHSYVVASCEALRCAVQCAGSHGLPHRTPRFGSASCCPLSYIATRSQTRVHVPLLCLLPRHAAAQPHHALHPFPSLAPAARSRTAPRRPRLTRRCRRRRCAAARCALLALTVPMACLTDARRQAAHRLPLWHTRAGAEAMQLP